MVWEALIILLLIIQSEKLFWLLSPHFQLTKISLDKPLPEGNWKLCSTMYWQPQQLHVSICSVQSFSRVWLCDHMDCSTAGLPVHHQLLEFTQTHVHWVSDAIQPSLSSDIPFSSCPQSFPASGSFLMSQLFASGGQNTRVSASMSVLPMNTQDRFPLGWTGGSPCIFSNTTVQ